MPLPVERSQGSVSALVARFQTAADRDKESAARESRRASLQPPSTIQAHSPSPGHSPALGSTSGAGAGDSSRRTSYGFGYGFPPSPSPGHTPKVGASPLPDTKGNTSMSAKVARKTDVGNSEKDGQSSKSKPFNNEGDKDAESNKKAGIVGLGIENVLHKAGEKLKSLESSIESTVSPEAKSEDTTAVRPTSSTNKQDQSEVKDDAKGMGNGKERPNEINTKIAPSSLSRPPKSPKRMSSSTAMSSLASAGSGEPQKQQGDDASPVTPSKPQSLAQEKKTGAREAEQREKEEQEILLDEATEGQHTLDDEPSQSASRTKSVTTSGTASSRSKATKSTPTSAGGKSTKSLLRSSPSPKPSGPTVTPTTTATKPRSRLSSGPSSVSTARVGEAAIQTPASKTGSSVTKSKHTSKGTTAASTASQPTSTSMSGSARKLTPSHTGPAPRRPASVASSPLFHNQPHGQNHGEGTVPSPLKPHLTGTPSKPTASSLAKARTPSGTTPAHGAVERKTSVTKGTGGRIVSGGSTGGNRSVSGHRARERVGTASPSPSPRPRPDSSAGTGTGIGVRHAPPTEGKTPSSAAGSGTESRLLQGTAASRARAAASHSHAYAHPHQQGSLSSHTQTASTPSKTGTSGRSSTSTPAHARNTALRSKTPTSTSSRTKIPSGGLKAKVKPQSHADQPHSHGSDATNKDDDPEKEGRRADIPRMPPVGRSPIGRLGLAAAGMKRPQEPDRRASHPHHDAQHDKDTAEDADHRATTPSGTSGEVGADGEEEAEEIQEIASHSHNPSGPVNDIDAGGEEDPIPRPRTPSPTAGEKPGRADQNDDLRSSSSDVKVGHVNEQQEGGGGGVVIASPDVPLVDRDQEDEGDQRQDEDEQDHEYDHGNEHDQEHVKHAGDANLDVGEQGHSRADESLEEIPDIE